MLETEGGEGEDSGHSLTKYGTVSFLVNFGSQFKQRNFEKMRQKKITISYGFTQISIHFQCRFKARYSPGINLRMPLFNELGRIFMTHIELDEYIKISYDTRIKKCQIGLRKYGYWVFEGEESYPKPRNLICVIGGKKDV